MRPKIRKSKLKQLEMWANAQRDGRPAEYRWRRLFNAAVWLCSYGVRCQDAKPVEISWVPQSNETISAASISRSSRYCRHMWPWGRYCYLTSFFPIVDTCLSYEDIARQSCAMVPRWRFLAIFWVLHFQRAACSTFQTCILNSH